MLVDTHVHSALFSYEPVEMLIAQMELNGIDHALLVQTSHSTDMDYHVDCAHRFPGRFSIACRVDVDHVNALADLERRHRAGIESLRLKTSDRSPGLDPLAIWKRADELGMSISVRTSGKFVAQEFRKIAERFPNLKLVLEHLAGIGLAVTGRRAMPAMADFQEVMRLSEFPNVYVKVGGLGEICAPPFPYRQIPPYISMVYEAFGARRMMWGSDWPPVVVREGYRNALRHTMEKLDFLSEDDRQWIFGRTAASIWKFGRAP